MGNILIIDDDQLICETLTDAVRDLGHNAEFALTIKEGLKKARGQGCDVVFLDVRMPDGNGLEALPRLRETQNCPEIIIITGFGDINGAEIAIKNKVWDYIQKPFSKKEMMLTLMRAIQYREEKQAKKPVLALNLDGILGGSPRMQACYDLLAKAARSEANVLITGETGTGKELFAQAIHRNSTRAPHNFVVVDCTVLPETLVESTLFGYEKGAFTGAAESRQGLIKQADQGTLFLDEVGELPRPVQKSFLRVLHERRFRPLGSTREIASDFRLVAATHRNLEQMVQQGQFRQDLLFRLQSLTIELPPLRERKGDIKELVMYYLAKFWGPQGEGSKGLSQEFLDALLAYDWPGNVRDLVNTLEGVVAAASAEPMLIPQHLPSHIRIQAARSAFQKGVAVAAPALPASFGETVPKFHDYLEEMKAKYLKNLLAFTGKDLKKASRLSGMSRSSLYGNLKKYQIIEDK
ncbi:MAG: sigma-54-dependent Fis family transcriptional regulator [Deltaproteobacteria bacterium]|nr:MAG: sigma-54-dependent Fis family transcriptional regulator [Deltaproteobacteria bacterium]